MNDDPLSWPPPIHVYISSKTRHAQMWRDLRARVAPHIQIISSWIDASGPVNHRELWTNCVHEASNADYLIAFTEHPHDVLKGALVEIGSALGCGVEVIVVGPVDESAQTWLNHPRVSHAFSMTRALHHIQELHEIRTLNRQGAPSDG